MKINEFYESKKEDIKAVLEKEGVVKLEEFFEEPSFEFELKRDSVFMKHKYQKGTPIELKIPFLKHIIGKDDFSFTPIVMTHGDFSMATEDSDGFDVIIDMTEDWPENAGGAIVYGDQAIKPSFNSLIIMKKGMFYFQYCNHNAENRVFLIAR